MARRKAKIDGSVDSRLSVEDSLIDTKLADSYDTMSGRANSKMVQAAMLQYIATGLSPELWNTYDHNPARFAAGIALVVGGLSAATVVRNSFKKNFNGKALRNENREGLVTDGAHGQLQHPMYVSYGTMSVGATLLSPTWPVITLGAVAIGAGSIAAAFEEKALEARFGQEHRDYQNRTPRIIPRTIVDGARSIITRATPYLSRLAQIIAP